MRELEYYRRVLSKEEINQLPMAAYNGPIRLVETPDELEQALELLRGETVLGFDTETRPCFEKGKSHNTSLMQLASKDAVVLVRLGQVPMSGVLADVLADVAVIKSGVGIREDMRLLGKKHVFSPATLFDLGDAARTLGLKTQGLRTLAANLMGVRISKGAQCSNWEKMALTPVQIRYAATDAWIGRELYFCVQELLNTSAG